MVVEVGASEKTAPEAIGPLRPATDAPRVHDGGRPPRAAPGPPARVLEDLPALHEEGAPLLEAGLEGGEVDHRRIHLDLPEIGVCGGVQGEVRAQTVFQVRARSSKVVGPGTEGVGERHIRRRRLANVLGAQPGVGQNLEPAPRSNPLDSPEMPVPGHAAGFELGREREDRTLLLSVDGALDLEAPQLVVGGAEAQLAEGDAHLHEPAVVGDGRGDVPDRIPGTVSAAVPSSAAEDAGTAAEDLVALHPRGVGAEAICGAMVVVAVDDHREEVRIGHSGVAAGEPGW